MKLVNVYVLNEMSLEQVMVIEKNIAILIFVWLSERYQVSPKLT